MKTPVQKFYDFLEQNQYFVDNVLYAKYRELIKEEKEIIEEAFSDGLTHYPNDSDPRYVRDYYNETFKTKEK